MTTNDFIFASYGALITAAGITMVLYAIYLKNKWIGWRSFFDEVFRVGLGIFFIAVFTFTVRSYFQVWKSGDYLGIDTDWMLNHVFVVYVILGFSFWYNWHTASVTLKKYGHKIWILSSVATVFSFFTTLYFTQHNKWAIDLVQWFISY